MHVKVIKSKNRGGGGQQTANKRLPWITLEVQKMKQVKNQGMEEISEALQDNGDWWFRPGEIKAVALAQKQLQIEQSLLL